MFMLFFVGTSGWNYFWNKDGNLEWYIKNTQFNAVELNMSFYRFPWRSLPKRWSRVGDALAWSIKVNQIITHRLRFSSKALGVWRKFRSIFEPMERKGLIHFYLFQCPPSFKPTPKSVDNLEKFIEEASIAEKLALEFRHKDWFKLKWERWASRLGITFVSVDAPDLPRKIFRTSNRIYVRLHGREAWYSHIYTEAEIEDIIKSVLRITSKDDYVYFFLNNNHGMLPTGNLMIRYLNNMGYYASRG